MSQHRMYAYLSRKSMIGQRYMTETAVFRLEVSRIN